MNGEPIHNHYKNRAEHYGEFVPTYRDSELTISMLESLQLSINIKALDLGAGQGDSSRHLRAMGADVTYLDASSEMLRRGIERGNIPNGKNIVCDISKLKIPFKDCDFDIVVSRYMMHDIENKVPLFREINRVLKPGGKVQIVDMCADEWCLPFYQDVHQWKTIGPPLQCYISSKKALEQALKSSGFSISFEANCESVVESWQWVKEGQINEDRHDQIMNIVRKHLKEKPKLTIAFDISFSEHYFTAHFPVIILVAEKEAE